MPPREDAREAKRAVLREWDRLAKIRRRAPDTQGMQFFQYLQERRPDLLDFQAGMLGQWQVVRDWLLSAGKISAEPPNG